MPLRLALSAPRRPPGSAYKSVTDARLIRALVRARTFIRTRAYYVRASMICVCAVQERTTMRLAARIRGFIGDAETIRAEIGQLY